MNIPSADTDAWNTAESQMNGRPSLIRYRPNLESHLGDPNYPKRLTIFWDYEDDGTSGMPTSELSDEMRSFEDALVKELDPDRIGIFAFVYTCAATREWHFYVGHSPKLESKINHALSGLPKLPIELQLVEDAAWEELQQVYKLCS